MATAAAPTTELTVNAPDGAAFEFEEVKTQAGTVSLGEVPILVWKDLDKAIAFYGEESVLDSLDGTSLRVSFQSIARRNKIAGKSNDEIATAEIAFRPGKRQGGVSTPASRAQKVAKQVAEKVGGSAVEQLLAMVASGQISLASLGIQETKDEETAAAASNGAAE